MSRCDITGKTTEMKSILTLLLFFAALSIGHAQNTVIIQQNSAKTQNQKPKVVYKDRIVYKEKERKEPVLVGGYLYVYPEKLGCFRKCPQAIINGINKKRTYGRSTWRLPTSDEVEIIESCKEINLRDYGVYPSSMNWGITTVIWCQDIQYAAFSTEMKMEGCLILVCDD